MGRSPCCDDQSGLKKGPWTTEEDQKLTDYITRQGHGSWRALPTLAGLNRCGKSCRLRWTNYLRPDIKRGKFTEDEDRVIINLHSVLGNKWSKIATQLPGRTDNEIKNYWNTHLRKKLLHMGIDPHTHKPRTDLNHLLNFSQLLRAANVGNRSMMSPWNNALSLQAGAAQLAKMQLLQNAFMQIVNSSGAPPNNMDMMNTGPFGSLNLNPLGRHVNGTSTMLRGQELNLDKVNDFHTVFSNSLEGFENVLGTAEGVNMNNIDHNNMNPLPALVSSASPGTSSTTNQMEISSMSDPAAADYLSTHSPTSIFEAWEKLMDDETSESYWKDILESIS